MLGIQDGRATRRPVRLGLRGNTQFEILEGMTEGEDAIPSNSGVFTGQRVRAILP
jgi:HlyD family secretion protein